MDEPIDQSNQQQPGSSVARKPSSIPSISTTTPARERMFRKIIYSPDAFFKRQQLDETDLDEDEKHSICARLFTEDRLQFLARYHRFLDADDVACFREEDEETPSSKNDVADEERYEIDHYLNEMSKRKRSNNNVDVDSIVKNRRYVALKQLIGGGEYFGDYEMRERDPLLYDRMIGQYQNEDDQQRAFHSGDRRANTLSSALLDMYDAKELSKRRQIQMITEEASDRQSTTKRAKQQCDSDEEELEDDDEAGQQHEVQPGRGTQSISNEEKQNLRDEFIREMKERFLDGRDSSFDYRTVDENPEYDLIGQQSQDDEDKYFDEEEPDESGHDTC